MEIIQNTNVSKLERRRASELMQLADFHGGIHYQRQIGIKLSAVDFLFTVFIIQRIVEAGVTALNMKIFVIHSIKTFMRKRGFVLNFVCGLRDAALLRNFRKVAVNIRNKLGGSLIDGFQRRTEFFQLLVL